MMLTSRLVAYVLVCLLVALVTEEAQAQDADRSSRFGIQASIGHDWFMPELIKKVFPISPDNIDLRGREVRVGIVRGRAQGGDWGLSYSENSIDPASTIRTGGGCPVSPGQTTCSNPGTLYRLTDVSFKSLELHKYVPLVTIARRVQLGLNFSGGALWVKGTAEKQLPSGAVSNVAVKDVFAEEDMPTTLASIRGEGVIGIIASEHFKIKASYGIMGLPGVSRLNFFGTFLF